MFRPTPTRPCTGCTTNRCCATWAPRDAADSSPPVPPRRRRAKLQDIASRPGQMGRAASASCWPTRPRTDLTITHVLWAMFGSAGGPGAAPAPAPVGGPGPDPRAPAVAATPCWAPGSTSAATSSTRSGWTGRPAAPSSPRRACGTPTTTRPITPAHLIPVQDAGLQTYLRSLDIKFTQRRDEVAG